MSWSAVASGRLARQCASDGQADLLYRHEIEPRLPDGAERSVNGGSGSTMRAPEARTGSPICTSANVTDGRGHSDGAIEPMLTGCPRASDNCRATSALSAAPERLTRAHTNAPATTRTVAAAAIPAFLVSPPASAGNVQSGVVQSLSWLRAPTSSPPRP